MSGFFIRKRRPYDHPSSQLQRHVAGQKREVPIADPGNFLWKTRDGGGAKIRVNDMKTDHIFYSLRFVFNSIAPKELRVGPADATTDAKVAKWNNTYLRQATRALLHVLSKRTDLPKRLQAQYSQMAERCCQAPTTFLELVAGEPVQSIPEDVAKVIPPGMPVKITEEGLIISDSQ